LGLFTPHSLLSGTPKVFRRMVEHVRLDWSGEVFEACGTKWGGGGEATHTSEAIIRVRTLPRTLFGFHLFISLCPPP
jgi:hypothetical protein